MIERKRVNVEFISRNDVVLTTPYFQKKFHLEDNVTVVDILSLKQMKDIDIEDIMTEPPSSMFITFFYDDVEDSYIGEVLACIQKDELTGIGIANCREANNKNFEVSVWIND